MLKSKLSALLVAGAMLVLSPAPVSAQAAPRPVLGVRIEVQPQGAVIVEVLPDRTAAAIGFQVGDVLIEAGDRPVSQEVLQQYWAGVQEGDLVRFRVRREGAIVELTGRAVAGPQGTPAPAAQSQV